MHFISKGLPAALIGAVLALCAAAAPAAAFDASTNIAFVQVASGTTSIPVGHSEFCKTHRSECQPNAHVVAEVALDEGHWSQLLSVNANVNATVVPVTDQDLYQVSEFWTYPNGYGDCEDIALEKRRELIEAGWPVSTLLMAVVRQRNGEGHAVLMVRTDRGDLVLDNQEGEVRVWNQTPYQYIKRQSQADAGKWVDMIDDRSVAVAAAN
jgi:predicted transglutaminase-like cysteine proteinase